MFYGDGREERMDALTLELRLRLDPEVTRRRKAYQPKVQAAREKANGMDQAEIVARLIENNPAYIRDLLETEDERFGPGALAERYARTFYNDER